MADIEPPPLRRDPGRLRDSYDLLVIGGGISGAWAAYDAALRGLSVAIVEATDWGGGTSSASSKLVHGGLRYLEYGRLGLVRTALLERERLLRLGPHRVHPLRFLVPIWRDSRMRPWQLRLGLTLYDLLSGVRGAGRHRHLGREHLAESCPFLDGNQLQNAFSYVDACEDDARLVLEIISGAVGAGAVAINHCPMRRLLGDGEIEGAVVEDAERGCEITIRARLTLLATGPWLSQDAKRSGLPVSIRLNKGVHLVMPPLPAPMLGQAVLLTARTDQRVFFLIPWYGATLLGTTDGDWQGDPSQVQVEPSDVDYLLREACARCPGLGWSRRDIRGAFAGLRTLQQEAGKSAVAATREWILSEPRPRLLVPIGGKLTSARADSALVVDRACRLLGRQTPCATADRALPWAPAQHADWLPQALGELHALGLDPELSRTMAGRYGSCLPQLLRLMRAEPMLRQRVHPQAPMALAETLHAVRAEMARTLHDVLRRRVPVAILARLELSQVERVATLIAAELGWDQARAQHEAGRYWQRHHEMHLRLTLEDPVPPAAAGGSHLAGPGPA